jgi:alkaline phosphatase
MSNFRRIIMLVIVTALALPLAVQPSATTSAQDGDMMGPAVLVYPVDQASFLPGVYFDFYVEVEADALPDDFSATVNGTPAPEFFNAEWETYPIESGEGTGEFLYTAARLNQVMFTEAGEYTVEVTAGGDTHTYNWDVRTPGDGEARNVILFIADGGSIGIYTAARLLSRGMDQGFYRDNLSFENFEEIGFLHTSGIDSIITDSANSASSYNTGHKTAVNANGVYPDSSPDALDDPRTEKLAYILDRTRGMSIGVVTTSDFTDATPNAVWGYGRTRSSSSRAAYAAQILDEGLLPEVILGGGARYLLPQSADGSARADDRDLFSEYEEAGYTIVTSRAEMEAALAESPQMLVGMFNPSDMNVWLDKNVYTENVTDFPDQPNLDEMTMAAIEVLSQNEEGFYLEVEAASIDKQLHPMDFDRALADAIEFDRAVAAAAEWAAQNAPDTLIIVTSDHAHSYDVFGTVDVEAFNAAEDDTGRRNAIGIYSAAGFPTYTDEDGDYFPDEWDVSVTLAQGKVENPPFTEDFQVSTTPRTPAISTDEGYVDNPEDDPNGLPLGGNLPAGSGSSVHTLQDVPVYAQGPGSECLGRVLENVEIFFCIANALGLDPAGEGM